MYPSAPFSPGKHWPEYPFSGGSVGQGDNCPYELLRTAFELLGMDSPRAGRAEWNPLRELISPGDTVVIKPNFVRDFRETHAGDEDCLVTHGALIRAVADYAYIALQGRGRIVVADAPQNDADFQGIRRITQIGALQQFYREQAGFNLEVYDLRPECADKVDGVIVGHRPLPGDPAGYVCVDLGRHSRFSEVDHLCHRLYGAEYDTSELREHHCPGRHEYLVSKTILQADCVISLPKLKTHKKTGLTASLKNLVGINGNKNWLPHHREGTPRQQGDQYADDRLLRRIESGAMACFRRAFPLLGPLRPWLAQPAKRLGKSVFGDTNVSTIRSGNWYGNDTTWRMVHDLNCILLYADAEGNLHEAPVRRCFSIVDGIVAGEGNGPLDCTPCHIGVIVAGSNPVAVDMACAAFAGFEYRRMPLLARAFDPHDLPLVRFDADDVTACSCRGDWAGRIIELNSGMRLRPHFGWAGHIEAGEDGGRAF